VLWHAVGREKEKCVSISLTEFRPIHQQLSCLKTTRDLSCGESECIITQGWGNGVPIFPGRRHASSQGGSPSNFIPNYSFGIRSKNKEEGGRQLISTSDLPVVVVEGLLKNGENGPFSDEMRGLRMLPCNPHCLPESLILLFPLFFSR